MSNLILSDEHLCSIQLGGGTFQGHYDPVLIIGFNCDKDGRPLRADRHKFVYQMENNYWDGRSFWIEKNLDFRSATGKIRRFDMFMAYRDDPDVMTKREIAVSGDNGYFAVTGPSNIDKVGSPQYLKVEPSTGNTYILNELHAKRVIPANGATGRCRAKDILTIENGIITKISRTL